MTVMKKQIVLLLLFPMGLLAQDRILKKADKIFSKEEYVSAIEIYEHLANKGMGSEKIYEKLGDANYFNANYVKAEHWYTKRYELKGTFPKEFLYRYGQSLKSAGKTQKANEIMAQFARENPTQLRAKIQIPTKAQESIKKGSDLFLITNLNINSKYSDYSSSIKGDTLLFASARTKAIWNKTYDRTGQPFTNLYYAIKQADGNYSNPTLYSKNTFSIYHEASPVFTKDGKTMYYTQNELKPNNQKKVVNGRYKIYKSVYQNGKWNNLGVQDIFAKDNARVAHPALSPDGKTLYFASDAQSTFGQSDLFKVTIKEDGSYTVPENLGNTINTEGRESYPFVTEDNILIFSSDGHPGQGGFDIFVLDLNQKGASPVHLKSPLNSAFDDFGLNWDRQTNNGVFTSNRPEGQGDDDLYVFSNTNPFFEFDYNARIIGKVLDKNTNLSIANVTVVLYDNKGKELAKTSANETGDFFFEKVLSNNTYTIRVIKKSYSSKEIQLSLPLYEREISTSIFMDKESLAVDDPAGCRFVITVLDKETNLPIEGANVSIQGLKTLDEVNGLSKAGGLIKVAGIQTSETYRILASKSNEDGSRYIGKAETISCRVSKNGNRDIAKVIYLTRTQVGSKFKMTNIYYDLDKWNIRAEARVELEKIVEVLKQNPSIKIEIGSHTDSRQSKAFNLALSQRRAESALEYILKRGIAKSRLTAKGYGESQLVNQCSDGIKCSEEDHQLNRRSTFEIVEQ
jgi:outer membrane protein OmpA-like peptidoglycan-associated protein